MNKKLNGFINVAEDVNLELSKLKKEELCLLKKGKIVLKDLKRYYFKRCRGDLCYREVLSYEFASYLNIPSLKYHLALIPNINNTYDYGVISLDFHKNEYQYISGFDVLYDYNKDYLNAWGKSYNNNGLVNNLDNIFTALEYRYQFEHNRKLIVEKLMNQLIRYVFLFDILLANPDRHYRNWEIEESNNDANISVLFDNEDILLKYSNIPKLATNVISRKYDWYKNLEIFLRQSSSININYFLKIYNLLDVEHFIFIIYSWEEKNKSLLPIGLKNDMINTYISHYEKITDVLNRLSLNFKENGHGSKIYNRKLN